MSFVFLLAMGAVALPWVARMFVGPRWALALGLVAPATGLALLWGLLWQTSDLQQAPLNAGGSDNDASLGGLWFTAMALGYALIPAVISLGAFVIAHWCELSSARPRR